MNETVEFGDFQTPKSLAARVCDLLALRCPAPAAIVEPTCGVGGFLLAALARFPRADTALAVEINSGYVNHLKNALPRKTRLVCANFFDFDWAGALRDLPEPILVVGNPPWVTNSALGALGGCNLPRKLNHERLDGLSALTGKSNFDISEWMLSRLLEHLDGRRSTLGMLCKTTVARKVLRHAWKSGLGVADAEIRKLDAGRYFGAAVDACLLVCSLGGRPGRDCRVYRSLDDAQPAQVIGWRDEQLLADVRAYDRLKHLRGPGTLRWRSGVKHDCAGVFEFRKERGGYRNGLPGKASELADIEHDYLFPLLKSSELTPERAGSPRRWMLLTQQSTGADTGLIRGRAPLTWKYLLRHAAALDRRASSIYRKRPRFSVFGVGPYTFAPWKVAISGFYKRLQFVTVGSHAGKPIVLDDTAYFVPCKSLRQADRIARVLNSDLVREFFSAFIFWDCKRPITSEVLNKLDLEAAAPPNRNPKRKRGRSVND